MAVKDNSCGIADLQDKMLDILKEFISLCDQYNLTYWLAFGSALGAIRHEGFIPWDDDLDVFMPRPDYERIWELIGEKRVDNHYTLVRTTKDKNYHHRVMQLVDTDTTFVHSRCKDEDIEHGLYIDIIPLDGCPEEKLRQFSQVVNAVIFSIFNIQCPPEYNGGKLTRLITIVTNTSLFFVRKADKRYRIWKRAEKRMTRYDWNSCQKVKSLCGSFGMLLTTMPREWFGERKVKFEDTEAMIPEKTEEFLTAKYGDYMRLPPEFQRVVRHRTEYIDLNTPYIAYKGIYYCNELKRC